MLRQVASILSHSVDVSLRDRQFCIENGPSSGSEHRVMRAQHEFEVQERAQPNATHCHDEAALTIAV